MQSTMFSIKMDKELKQAAQSTANELGLPLGTMINAFLRQLVRQKEFTLTVAERPSAYLLEVLADFDTQKGVYAQRRGKSMPALLAELHRGL